MTSMKRMHVATFAVGFALSGFFDGVLLHQILQWHHLLSALDGDLRFQIAADGWFHVLMYVVAVWGLWQLWSARSALVSGGSGKLVAAWSLIGFGCWHVVDAIGSHWLLGIHRIRMDSDIPLAWDIGWLTVFGIVPVVVGCLLRSNGTTPRGQNDGRKHGIFPTVVLLALTLPTGYLAARPVPGSAVTTVVFGPSVSGTDAVLTALATGRSLVWTDGKSIVVTTQIPRLAMLQLYLNGAIYVGGAGLPPSCFSWSVVRKSAAGSLIWPRVSVPLKRLRKSLLQ